MKEETKKITDERLTRRHFMKGGAGVVLAAGCLVRLGPHAEAVGAGASQSASAKVYTCPPCGLPCDKLTFDKPGNCPNCGMKLIPIGGGADSPPTVVILLF